MIADMNAGPLPGLLEADAQARLKAEGYNELPRAARRTPLRILLEVLREPMLALLLVGGLIYLTLGDLQEALILIAFASMSIVITIVQETRTERVLEALRDLTSPRASVIRDGKLKRIAGREVVRGDLVALADGDRVPADAVLVESHDLQTDESLLTGESVPVRKIASSRAQNTGRRRPGGDDLPFVFSGSLVVRGTGLAEVTATGTASEIGKIGRTLSTFDMESPRLYVETRRLVRVFAIVGGIVSIVVVLLYGLLRGGWLEAVLAGVALGMSMLPEEFPVVLTVFMTMGAWRISRARVLTRRSAAIETLGSATVLCTDKTGTLTENRMSIAELRLPDGKPYRLQHRPAVQLPEDFRELVETGVLASVPQSFDPMERAFLDLGRECFGDGMPRPGAGWTLLRAFGLRPDLLAMSQVWRTEVAPNANMIVAAKGAPEAVAELCHLAAADVAALTKAVNEMAAEGLRVLGVARATSIGGQAAESQHDFPFTFAGLIGLADPLRLTVPDAVKECRTAGIKIFMITGDYPTTARAIAKQAGIDAENVVTGDELEALSDTELQGRVNTATIFARIMPEQKLRIVKAFKANGEIVAMTGDGVNDAPSLKAAHIGVAMGGRGTDVAREASSIVLLDDDFGSIVKAIRLGRRVYDNLQKAMGFIFAVHIPIAGLALTPLLFGLPIILGPVHIAFLEMVIDPVCSLVFEGESEEADVMRRPPRDPAEALFSTGFISWGLVQGTVAFLLVGLVYGWAVWRGMSESEVRALVFFTLVLAIISLIFVNRSFSSSLIEAFQRPNPALILGLIAVAILLALTLLWNPLMKLFRFGPLHADDLALTISAGLFVLVLLELMKLMRKVGPKAR